MSDTHTHMSTHFWAAYFYMRDFSTYFALNIFSILYIYRANVTFIEYICELYEYYIEFCKLFQGLNKFFIIRHRAVKRICHASITLFSIRRCTLKSFQIIIRVYVEEWKKFTHIAFKINFVICFDFSKVYIRAMCNVYIKVVYFFEKFI